MATICIFGDSIAWGASDPVGGGWVTCLQNYYKSQDLPVDKDVDVYNLGVSGDNTDDLLKRFEVEADAREPSTILFAIGINDSQFVTSENVNRIPKQIFEQNLKKLLELAKQYTDRIAFVGLTDIDESKTVPIPWNPGKTYTVTNRDAYNSAINDFCSAHSIPFLSLSGVVSLGELPDGLHPDSNGHQKIFEAVLKFIEENKLTEE